jgi:hypothetical protein
MRSPRLRLLLASPLAALVLVGCGPSGPSIPAIPGSVSGDHAVAAETGKAAVQKKGKRPGPQQKRLTQLSPMPWPRDGSKASDSHSRFGWKSRATDAIEVLNACIGFGPGVHSR